MSQAIWPWQATAPEPPAFSRQMRALGQFGLMLLISLVLFFAFDKIIISAALSAAAVVILVSGLFFPAAFDAIDRGKNALGTHVATGLTWVLLVPFFYLVFGTSRLILRIIGKDPLCRRVPTRDETYWIRRPPVDDMERYRKPY